MVFSQCRIKKQMKWRSGLGSGSALVRLPGSAVRRPVGTQLREERFWVLGVSHQPPILAWWVSFVLGTVASFWGRVLFPFLLAQVIFSCSERSHRGCSPNSPGTEQPRQRVLSWPQASSSHFLRSSSGRSADHSGRQPPSRKALEQLELSTAGPGRA